MPHNGAVHVEASAVRIRDCLVFHVATKNVAIVLWHCAWYRTIYIVVYESA